MRRLLTILALIGILGCTTVQRHSDSNGDFLGPYVQQLKKELSPKERKQISAMAETELIGLHRSYGMYIRNKWLLGKNPDQKLLQYFRSQGINHPYTMSTKLIRALWEDLNEHLSPHERGANKKPWIAASVERIARNDLKSFEGGMPGEKRLRKEVAFSTEMILPMEIEVTAKGNGILKIGNLKLKVFDSNSDGSYYENDLLTIDVSDINGDGRRELLISGIVCFTDEKGDRVVRSVAIVSIFALQDNGKFKPVYQTSDFQIY